MERLESSFLYSTPLERTLVSDAWTGQGPGMWDPDACLVHIYFRACYLVHLVHLQGEVDDAASDLRPFSSTPYS